MDTLHTGVGVYGLKDCRQYNIFDYSMFQSNNEKGLFTFYWEQAQKQQKNIVQSPFSLPISPKKANCNKKLKLEIEEKPMSIAKSHKPTKNKTIYQALAETHNSTPSNKQNREYVSPNTFDLSSKLAEQLTLKTCNSTQNKCFHKKRKQKKSCKLPLIKTTVTQQVQQVQTYRPNSQFLQKLVFKDQAVSPRPLTIQIQTEAAKSRSFQGSRCAKKTKKMDTQRSKKVGVEKKLSVNFEPLGLGQTHKTSPRQLPVISPRTLGCKKTQNSHIFQKMVTEKPQEINGQSSVINIGVTSRDEYKQRWMKRKEQFMSLLAKKMSGQNVK